MRFSRRTFVKTAVGAAAGLGAESLIPAEAASGSGQGEPQKTSSLPNRMLGRTGRRVSILGIGMAPLGSDQTSFAEAEAVVHHALDSGITYVDVSPDYGNAEDKLKNALKGRRDQVFLVTKVNPQQGDAAGVQRQIERSLQRMGVDTIDAVHIHNLGDFDMAAVLTDNGALGGLKEARRRGLIRFIGTSGHMRPARFATAFATGQIDLTMNALNFADRHNYAFEELALPVARQHHLGIVAMKVLGGARNWSYDGKTPATFAAYHEQAIRYWLGIPGVSTAVLGFSTAGEIDAAVRVARSWRPLSNAERTALLSEGERLARTRGLYYGPVTG